MAVTRRNVIQSALTGTALLAVGSHAFADASLQQPDSSLPAGSGPESAKTHSDWVNVKVSDGTEMRVYVSRPEKPNAKLPGMLVLPEVFGVNAFMRDVTNRIAALGYVAACPELFHRSEPGFESGYTDMAKPMQYYQAMTDVGLSADLKATYDLLSKHPQADATRIGSVGYCMGGRSSYLANAILPLKAAVVYYGGGIADSLLPQTPNQHGAILLFSGGKDTHIGREKQNAIAEALKKASKLYVDVEFSDAEHGFFCDQRGSYNAVAAHESWALFTSFLEYHLNKA
jgi:carboxymethylenebutenolidase